VRTVARSAAALVAVIAFAACGRGSSPSAKAGVDLETKADFVRAYGEQVVRLGVRITRAGRVASAGSDEYVRHGAHVAIYVEPVGGAEPEAYIDRMVPLAKLLVPSVLRRLPDVESMDVCQEPPSSVDDSDEPPPEVALLVYRRKLGDLDWDALDARALVALNLERPQRLSLAVSPRISQSAAWASLQGGG
jgi:hypothetical protein